MQNTQHVHAAVQVNVSRSVCIFTCPSCHATTATNVVSTIPDTAPTVMALPAVDKESTQDTSVTAPVDLVVPAVEGEPMEEDTRFEQHHGDEEIVVKSAVPRKVRLRTQTLEKAREQQVISIDDDAPSLTVESAPYVGNAQVRRDEPLQRIYTEVIRSPVNAQGKHRQRKSRTKRTRDKANKRVARDDSRHREVRESPALQQHTGDVMMDPPLRYIRWTTPQGPAGYKSGLAPHKL
ncbi:hypothetical protein AMS68_002407 [Peltaster fructicola]|uniref:Uncharacterized protein n=1 Tax=Peltaster fructicola TaxID=286661 RepID=A0A6H0XQZ6_9PEZI|nr:hypothetical protein AMS68_002407 [Peltaster fructicola]